MRLFDTPKVPDLSLNENNVTDWRLLIQHPNSGKSNNSEGNSIFTEEQRTGITRVQYGDQLIPLYCTILGLLIFCLIGYVIYKLWKQKSNSLPCTAIASKGGSGTSFRIPKYSPNKSNNKEVTALVPSSEEVKWHNCEQLLLNQSLYCLPEDQTEAIIFSLSDESSGIGWINLAQYYNVRQEEIDSIMQTNDNINAVRIFLKKWSENPNHNLKRLIKSLQEISRPDTALLIKSALKKFNRKENNETNNNLVSNEKQSNGNTVTIT